MRLIFSANLLFHMFVWKKANQYIDENRSDYDFYTEMDLNAKLFINNPRGDQESFPSVTHYPYRYYCETGQLDELMDNIISSRKKL